MIWFVAASCTTLGPEDCQNQLDDDGDGWTDCLDPACDRHCDSDGDGFRDAAYRGKDCDDEDPAVHPQAPEVCNGVDDDCDELVDVDDPEIDAATLVTGYLDRDGDGRGRREELVCAEAPDYAPLQGDCDDTDPAVYEGAPELCDDLDGDCDGLADADDPDVIVVPVFQDLDGDGHGDPRTAALGCPVDGWVESALDCDDGDANVFLGAPEICDGRDDDCDGLMGPDEGDGDGDGDPLCSDCDDDDPLRSTRLDERCGPVPIDDDCDTLVDYADPNLNLYTCGSYCPEGDAALFAATPIHEETWNPCVLDPEARSMCSTDPKVPDTHTAGDRLHRLSWREDQGFWRDELYLFLPPGPGRFNNKIRVWAAYAGYLVISLGYPNDDVLEFKCATAPDICFRDSLYETTYGVDLSYWVDVDWPDSITRRLEVLLEHLTVVHPGMGFDRYLLPGGGVDWSRIVVGGWSGGGAQAGFIAHYEPVAAALMMSSPKDHRTDPLAPVDWISAPSVTPGCAMFSTWHVDEPFSAPPEEILGRSWDLMGVPDETWDLDADGRDPPAGIHRVSQSLAEGKLPTGCTAHGAVGDDKCVRDELIRGYVDLYCELAEADPATCATDATAARTGR